MIQTLPATVLGGTRDGVFTGYSLGSGGGLVSRYFARHPAFEGTIGVVSSHQSVLVSLGSFDGLTVALGVGVLTAVFTVYRVLTDWNPPNSVIGGAISLVGGMVLVEVVGLYIFCRFYHSAALGALLDGGLAPVSGVTFLVSSLDRLIVAFSLAVFVVVNTFTGSNDPSFISGGP